MENKIRIEVTGPNSLTEADHTKKFLTNAGWKLQSENSYHVGDKVILIFTK